MVEFLGRRFDRSEGLRGVVVAVLLIAVVFGLGNMFGGPLPNTASLTSSLCGVSADDVRLDSNDPEIGGQAWVVEAVGACSSHIIEGGARVAADDIQGTNSEGDQVTAKTGLQLGLSNFEAFVYNPVSDRVYTEVNGVEKRTIEGSGRLDAVTDEDVQTCMNWQAANSVSDNDFDLPRNSNQYEYMDYVVTTSDGLLQDQTLHCFRATYDGEVRNLQSGTLRDFMSTWTMRADGKTFTKQVDMSEADGGFSIGEGQYRAHINYIGSLLNDVVDANINTNTWKVACDNNCDQPVNDDGYTVARSNYIDYYLDQKTSFESEVESDLQYSSGEVAGVNNAIKNVFADQSSQLADSIGYWVQDVRIEGNQLRVYADSNDALGRPEFVIRVAADWLGFNIQVADPSIESIRDVSTDAQSSTYTTVTVRNNADVGGRVQAGLSCPAPVQGGSQQQYIPGGGTASYSLSVDVASSPDASYDCDVKVKDIDAQNLQDAGTLTVDVTTSFPDQDGDGVRDANDECPNEAGPASNNGCPIEGEDSDNDGVPNDQDQCPGTPSGLPVDENGCAINQPEDEYPNGCSDGIDNDNDGLIDDRDPDCQGDGGGLPVIPIAAAVVIGSLLLYYRNVIISSLPSAPRGGRR